MEDQCHVCLLRLIILCPLLTGVIVAEGTHVFSSSGESVRLPCNKALSGCTSTTWNSNRQSETGTDELVALGIKKNDRERHERLSLGSDCSLNIEKVTQEDYGLYTCRQYVNGKQHGTDEPVYLHFLHVSSSSSHTETVTLSCQLYSYNFPCDTLVGTEGIQLVWVNQAGVNLQRDSRYQISFSSTQTGCISTLTTTLLNEDLSRDLRCLVTQRNEPKTSATFTVKDSAPVDSTTLIPVSGSNSEKKSSRTTAAAPTRDNRIITSNSGMTSSADRPSDKQVIVIVIVVVAALAVLLAVILWVICKKRADNKEEDCDTSVLTYVIYSGIPAENLSKRVIYSL